MTQNSKTQFTKTQICILVLSIFGLLACIAILFPQVRQMSLNYLAVNILHKQETLSLLWHKTLMSYAMGGIFFILLFDYCTLTTTGKMYALSVKQEINDCLAEIDFRSLLKPSLFLSGIYLLGILTIIRANLLYHDDIGWSITGYRDWFYWSRYVIVLLSYFIQPEINMTDISPLPQLLSVLIMAISSALLIYITGNKKITLIGIFASIPLGLSPYFLECMSYKFAAPYFAFSILLSIIPFLFVTRKKAFFFCSVISLLLLCLTYQAAAGLYLLLVVILVFQDWNHRKKTDKEILSFLSTASLAFSLAMLCFKFFFMRHNNFEYINDNEAVSSSMHSLSQMLPGIFFNIKNYAITINNDLGLIWKICITLICIFFVIKSVSTSSRNKLSSFLLSLLTIGFSCISSYGIYFLLAHPLFYPRALFGFGAFLAVLCIYIVTDYKRTASIPILALSWCFFVFSFSYGNALSDQARYAEFRISILLQDLSVLYPDCDNKTIQLKNSIDFTPSIKNISKHNPIIERLVPKRFDAEHADTEYWSHYYLYHFNFSGLAMSNIPIYSYNDFTDLNMPVVLDSYYHTIQSDGEHILITLKH